MDETDMEEKINFIAVTTLGALKDVFEKNGLDDRQATLSLFYFMQVFIENGWKGEDPIKILEETIKVAKFANKQEE